MAIFSLHEELSYLKLALQEKLFFRKLGQTENLYNQTLPFCMAKTCYQIVILSCRLLKFADACKGDFAALGATQSP